eukprot:CAMPEP_0180146678 /NCGR_PEP_ID=MMETSP0986-20121125/18687_1 /TAXON_ID=697907 /ORGANISM="non described non described, Strain CCMP2293" /LENGTH=284 /DNA_ID=CAMNT_0022091849 /DNA_START=47 /DNA_END=898 /DNA_ORIENTATION=-
MVMLHVKKTDELQFLFETAVKNSVDETVTELVEIWNMQIQIRRLLDSMDDLAKYGPAKPGDKQCIDTYATDDYGNMINDQIPRGPHYCMDPTGKRTGEAPEPRLAEVINRQVSDAKKVVDAKATVERRQAVTKQYFQECMDSLRGAVMIAFPEGLPEFDDVEFMLKGECEEDGRTMEKFYDGTELWWAGKQMEQGQSKKICDYLGNNDKTKIVCKLQKPGGGAPAREPAVNEQTQKEMMAFYHRKQEEMKKLADDEDDGHMSAAWANPNALKSHLQGTGGSVGW